MKTKFLLIGAVAGIAFAGPANAAVFHGFYVGLEGGGDWIQDAAAAVDNIGFLGSRGGSTFKTGWAALATLGYSWNGWRAELELGYRANDIDTFSNGLGTVVKDPGKFDEFSQMLNVVYDYDIGKWAVSFGVGGGGDRIDYKNAGYHTVDIRDTDWVPAWQLLVGLNYHLSSHADLFVDYRNINVESPEFTATAFDGVHNDSYDMVHKHAVTIGLRYALWDDEPRSNYVAPPEPPAPSGLPPKEFIVFFGHNKTTLVAHAIEVINEAAAAAKQRGSASISVIGHADRSGSNAYNDALSLHRAKVVQDALIARGIPQGAIAVSAKGESEPLVPTADGVREPQNRRVNIEM